MSAKPITMIQLRRILQLLNNGCSERSISKQTSVARNTIRQYKATIQASMLSFSALLELNDESLSKVLFDPEQNKTHQKDRYLEVQDYIKELESEPDRVKKILTKKLLWYEYKVKYPDGYEYSRFCDYIHSNEKLRNTVMHFFHKPGEKLMIDFAGDTFKCTMHNGEIKFYQVFVAVLSYSGYTYVEATDTQNQYDLLRCMENALKFFGGTPQYIISDNLKSCITKYNRYEPELTELMDQFCLHYQTAIIPARPAKPKDKPSVERHVRLVYERIYAPLRKSSFGRLKDLNEAFFCLTDKHNELKFRLGDKTRLALFNEFERDLLTPLPSAFLDVNKRSCAKVAKDYHVWLSEDKHFYSVPYKCVGQMATLLYNSTTVEIYIELSRVAVHPRGGTYRTTSLSHMPPNHYEYSKESGWTPDFFCNWASSISPDTLLVIEKMLSINIIKQQSFLACFGTLKLANKYSKERLAKACEMAVQTGVFRYRFIKNILDKNMDVKNFAAPIATQTIFEFHENNRDPKEFE